MIIGNREKTTHSIDGDDRGLDEGLGTDQLVVGGIVHGVDDTRLAGATLASPGEVSSVETESTELEVSSTATHGVHALRSDLQT